MLKIIPCGERFDELLQFVVRLNSDGAHHIGFFGEGEAEVRASLLESTIPPAEYFLMAYKDDQLVGLFGVDINPEIHRAWLFGPLVEHANWHEIADELYARLLPLIPAEMRQYDLFCDEKNIHIDEFAARHNFPRLSQAAIMTLPRQNYRPSTKANITIIPFEDTFFEPFEKLHNTTFPNTYYTAKQIVEKINASHKLFLAVDETRLLGYNFCKIEELGYIDFLGVDESNRGHGVGNQLLLAGVDWMFSDPEIPKVNLTVNADNATARHLYEKTGFVTERVMTGYRKQLAD